MQSVVLDVSRITSRPFSYSRYRTGTSLQLRLMRGVSIFLRMNLQEQQTPNILFCQLHASTNSIPRIRAWSIAKLTATLAKKLDMVYSSCQNILKYCIISQLGILNGDRVRLIEVKLTVNKWTAFWEFDKCPFNRW